MNDKCKNDISLHFYDSVLVRDQDLVRNDLSNIRDDGDQLLLWPDTLERAFDRVDLAGRGTSELH